MRINFKKAAQISIPAILFPMMAFAATDLKGLLLQISDLLNLVIGMLFIIVTLVFIWGIVQYVTAGGDDTKLAKGRKHMIWGIVGMAVMAGAWGIVRLILSQFNIGTGTGQITVPTFRF